MLIPNEMLSSLVRENLIKDYLTRLGVESEEENLIESCKSDVEEALNCGKLVVFFSKTTGMTRIHTSEGE